MFVIAGDRHIGARHFSVQHRAVLANWIIARANSEYFSDLRREFEQINYKRALATSYESRMYLFCYSARRLEAFAKTRSQLFRR